MNILLVEDNHSDAFLLRELLELKPNAPSLHWVSDGYQAIAYLSRKKPYEQASDPDLILLDLGLPRISGYEVLKQLKDQKDFTIPVVILTTSRSEMDRSQCMQLGADAFISKPHNLKDYENLVEKLITTPLPTVQ